MLSLKNLTIIVIAVTCILFIAEIILGCVDMEFPNLGKKIKQERLKRGITQQQLAEKVDISTNFMSLIENGRNMSVDTLIKIADVFSVSVDYLLSDTMDISGDNISAQISYNLSSLNDDEKLFFLNMIKQYKNIER